MSSELVIQARGLGKAYPVYRRPEDRLKQLLLGRWRRYYQEYWALQDVTFSVNRGETVGIIGRNGSGKSTLLQLICGTLQPSTGDVKVRGRVAALLELGAGFNPQFTGRENVALSASVLGLSEAEIADRFEAIAAFAEIGDFMDQPVRLYSSGMYARLAFAVCAHVDADVLIVDEILAVGDAAFRQKCMRFLNRFRMHGSLLFVSHDNGAVVKLCDRALWLEQGVVQASGSAKDVCRLYVAAQAEEQADSAGRFLLGGRSMAATRPARRDDSFAPTEKIATNAVETFDFDPDNLPAEIGGVRIELAAFFDDKGQRLRVASGGEEVELRIVCSAERSVAKPVFAFTLRDRLGQVLISDDTFGASHEASPLLTPDQRARARFFFALPYLPNGPYAIEAHVFDGDRHDCQLLRSLRDREFLWVQSRHISHGLANVAMREVSLTVESPDAPSEDAGQGLDDDAPCVAGARA